MNTYKASDIIKELYEYSIDNNNELTEEEKEKAILQLYTNPENPEDIGMEIPDILSNINGNHIHKLISAKDIDFDNVFLKNSNITDEMWGEFDPKRRWPNNYAIHINDSYELMNVIDYLLYATKEMWNEINKMKYDSIIDNVIWFINDLDKSLNNIIDPEQFIKGSNYAIYLDPTKYYVTLPSLMNKFGIATYFVSNNDSEQIIRTIARDNGEKAKRNGIKAYIPTTASDNLYYKIQVENKNGVNINVYGYLIQGLKFYSMFDIDNFFFDYKVDNKFDYLINKTEKTMNYELFFRTVSGSENNPKSTFHRLYVDYLYNNYAQIGHPYILYFITEDENSKPIYNIIYIHLDEQATGMTVNQIIEDLQKYSRYKNYSTSLGQFGSQNDVYYSKLVGQDTMFFPYLYYRNDTGKIVLSVKTPSNKDYNETTSTLDIMYFKKSNNISYTVNIKNMNSEEVSLMKDLEQSLPTAILNCPSRYYLPSKTNIFIKLSANYLNNDKDILDDDEFMDVLLPIIDTNENQNIYVNNDEEAKKYYYYNGLNEEFKRIFINFTSAQELNEYANNQESNVVSLLNIDNESCIHLYKKTENPYKMTYSFTVNQLLNQEINDIDLVENEVEKFFTNSELHIASNNDDDTTNYLKINGELDDNNFIDLSDDIEQIKFDINFDIEETSKVKNAHKSIPVSINKIHNPSIQFYSYALMNTERQEYQQYAYTFGDHPTSINYLVFTNNKTTPLITVNQGNIKQVNPLKPTIETDENSQFYTFSDIYSYLIVNKYNNFKIKDYSGSNLFKRNDIGYYVNSEQYLNNITEYNNIKNSLDYPSTYDNTIENSNLMSINYHTDKKYIGIFGDIDLLTKKFKKGTQLNPNYNLLNSIFFENTVNESDDFAKYKQSQNSTLDYITFNMIFNIYGLGLNYRRHGGDRYLYINRVTGPVNSNHQRTNLAFEDQYDIASNVCNNSLNNICKYLQVSLEDGNNQFDDIHNNIDNTLELDEDKLTSLINNSILSINIYQEKIDVQTDSDKWNNNPNSNLTVTYYVPMSYMDIKSTTFYPGKDILPRTENNPSKQYDLNNNEDVERYKNYVKFWRSTKYDESDISEDEKHKPITMSLQLKENLTSNTPFFNESNIAKAKFKVNRIDGTSANIKLSQSAFNQLVLNERYYIGDLISVEYNPGTVQFFSVGSYPVYNDQTGHFDIVELFDNKSEYLGDENTSALPIRHDNNNNYQYSIKHCSQMNKIKFSELTIEGSSPVNKVSITPETPIETQEQIGLLTDMNTLLYIQINENFINYFKTRYPDFKINNSLDDATKSHIRIIFNLNNVYGTKIYKDNSTLLTSLPALNIQIACRERVEGNTSILPIRLGANNTPVNINTPYFIYDGTYYKHFNIDDPFNIDDCEVFKLPKFPDDIDDLYFYDEALQEIRPLNIIQNIKTDYSIFYGMVLNEFNNYHLFKKYTGSSDSPITPEEPTD